MLLVVFVRMKITIMYTKLPRIMLKKILRTFEVEILKIYLNILKRTFSLSAKMRCSSNQKSVVIVFWNWNTGGHGFKTR